MSGDARLLEQTPEALFAGRYVLAGAVGQGAMGSVERAYDRVLRRNVAIKRLLPNMVSEARRARLLREARAVAALNHPSIIDVYDVGEAGGVDFIVMELVEGGTLEQRMTGPDRPTLELAVDWLIDVADALASAHRAGLVHRDIKPPNLLLTKEGRIKIADFGVVKEIDQSLLSMSGERPLTALGHIVGTPKYMAPEQLRAEAVDARTDEYAWGLVAYALLTGIHPYDAAPGEITMQYLADGRFVPPPFAGRLSGAVPEIEAVVRRTLAAEPNDRYPDMVAVKEALVSARRARSLTDIGRGPPAMMPVAGTTETIPGAKVPPTQPDHPPIAAKPHATLPSPNNPTLPSHNVQTLDDAVRPSPVAIVTLPSGPPPAVATPRAAPAFTPPMPRTSVPVPADPGRKIMGVGAIIFGVVAAFLILGTLGFVLIINAASSEKDKAKERIAELEAQIGTRVSSSPLESDVACALAEIHLLKVGFDGHNGFMLQEFQCDGRLLHRDTEAPMLTGFRFQFSPKQRYEQNVCFSKNRTWEVTELRADACPLPREPSLASPPLLGTTPPLSTPTPTSHATHAPTAHPTHVPTPPTLTVPPTPIPKPTPTPAPRPTPTTEPAACVSARQAKLSGKSPSLIAALEQQCRAQGGRVDLFDSR